MGGEIPVTSEWPALPLSHCPGDGPHPLLNLLTPSFLANLLMKFTLLANLLMKFALLWSNSMPPSPLAEQTWEVGFRANTK